MISCGSVVAAAVDTAATAETATLSKFGRGKHGGRKLKAKIKSLLLLLLLLFGV